MTLLNADSADEYAALMQQTGEIIKTWLESRSLYVGGEPETVGSTAKLQVTPSGLGDQAALARMPDIFLSGCISTANTACLAHLHPPTLLVGQLAEMLIAATNQSLDSWNQSPTATVMEQNLVRWLVRQCGFGENADGVFTSGGTQSNLMGLLLARDHYYQKFGIDVQATGIDGVPAGVILCSDQAHFSVEKNAGVLGLGRNRVVKIASDDRGVMSVAALAETITALKQSDRPLMAVVATAGTTDSGAIDPIGQIADICQANDIWLHVDAAWGGALLLSHRYRQYLAGLELADSVTLDFHKHFFLPISCGAFLVQDRSSFEPLRHHSAYLNPKADEIDAIPNLVTQSLQTTRRFDALKLWLALEALGTKKYGEMIDECLSHAQQAALIITKSSDLQLMTPPNLSSVLFYFDPKESRLRPDDLAQLNRQIAQQLLLKNIANIATTEFKSKFCLKLTILNPEVTKHTLTSLMTRLCQIGHQLLSDFYKDHNNDYCRTDR